MMENNHQYHLTCKTWEWNSCSHCFLGKNCKSVDSAQYNLETKQKIALGEVKKITHEEVLKARKSIFFHIMGSVETTLPQSF